MNKFYRVLLKSFDTSLKVREIKLLRDGLKMSDTLAKDVSFFSNLRATISSMGSPPSFEHEFVQKVVESAFSVYDDFGYWIGISFRRVSFATVMLCLFFVFHNTSIHGSVDVAGIFGLPEPTLNDVLLIERFLQ